MAEKMRISLKSLSRVDQGSWARATSSLQSAELPSQETLSHCVYRRIYMRVRSRRFRQHAHKSLLLSSGSAQPPSSPLRSVFNMRTSLIFSYYQEGNVCCLCYWSSPSARAHTHARTGCLLQAQLPFHISLCPPHLSFLTFQATKQTSVC